MAKIRGTSCARLVALLMLPACSGRPAGNVERRDTAVTKRCPTCYVSSYRVGYVAVRRRDESWEQAEHRVRTTPSRTFTGGANPASSSTADFDPSVRPLAEAMLRDARAAGFRFHVTATYRSPLREA